MTCAALFAQNPSFGIRGGLNSAMFSLTAVGNGALVSQDSKAFTTFNLGVFADLKLGHSNFSIQPALCYTGKGGNFSYNDNQGNVIIDTKLQYLELPVDLVGHIPAGIGDVYLGAGPYFARGLSGTIDGSLIASNGENGSVSSDIKFGNGTDANLSSTQFGINFIAGFKFKNGILLHLNYDLGTSNDEPSSRSSSGATNYSRVFSVSIGYVFK